MGATNSTLPPIKSEEDKQKLREELEKEYFEQRNEIQKAEKKAKAL